MSTIEPRSPRRVASRVALRVVAVVVLVGCTAGAVLGLRAQARLTDDLHARQEALELERAEVVGIDQQIGTRQPVLAETDATLAGTQAALADVQARIAATTTELAALDGTLPVVQADLGAAAAERDVVRGQLASVAGELKTLQDLINANVSQIDLKSGQVFQLDKCLNGVQAALNQIAVGDTGYASSLRAVQRNCDSGAASVAALLPGGGA